MDPVGAFVFGLVCLLAVSADHDVEEHNLKVDQCIEEKGQSEVVTEHMVEGEKLKVKVLVTACPEKRNFESELGHAAADGFFRGVGRGVVEGLFR